jgi:hypothetical protein
MSTECRDFRKRLSLKHAVRVREKANFNENDRQLLRGYNFDETEAAKYCSSVDFECMNHMFHGIAIRNLHNGLEFFDDNEFVTPKTVGVSGLVVIVNTMSQQKRSCLLFMDFKDLLAYLTLRKVYPSDAIKKIPKKSDYIVLNEIANWQFLFARINEYDNVYCLFPNTDIGEILSKTVDSLHKGKTIDSSLFYAGCKSLTDFLQLQKGRI